MTPARTELLAKGSVEVGRSCDEAFAYVSNLENFPDWFPGVASMRALDTTVHGRVGKRYSETLHLPFGRRAIVEIEVKEAQAGAHFQTEGDGLLLPGMRVEFSPIAQGIAGQPGARTRIDWRMVSRNQAWWFRWLVAPLVRVVMGRRARVGLLRLRNNLERDAA